MLWRSDSSKTKLNLTEIASRLVGVQYDPLPVIAQNHYVVFWNRMAIGRKALDFDELDDALYQKHTLLEFFGLRRVTSVVPSAELPVYIAAAQLPLSRGWTLKAKREVDSEDAHRLIRRLKHEGRLTKSDLSTDQERRVLYRLFWLVPEVVIVNRRPGVFREAEYAWGPDALPHVDFEPKIDTDKAVCTLLLKTVRAFGVCTPRHAAFWFGVRVRDIKPYLERLVEDDQLAVVRVADQRPVFYATPEDLQWVTRSDQPEGGGTELVHLLTPLDNLVRDRRWLDRLFDYSFKIEYFQVKGMRWHTSILVGDTFIGFLDPKVDRRRGEFLVKEVVLRDEVDASVAEAVVNRVKQLAAAHRCQRVRFEQTPSSWRPVFEDLSANREGSSFVVELKH
ncbi:MAG: DNA glycosylase AlkZ-like family protein [Candidatus Thorarchaeota archaeon]